jgi:hypothetical protein
MTSHSLFVLPGAGPPALPPRAALTRAGRTTHFDVYYDRSLGGNGTTLASDVLATAESDYDALKGWFAIGDPARLPFVVNIIPGSSGASHATCSSTTLNCDAFSGTDGDLVRMLVVAEADEVFMADQAKGWDCGASNGEGLSRVLAAERYPGSLNGFASASAWLNGGRPDFVSQTDPTDQNYVSIGCATLFINYLRHQLDYDLAAIVEAGGSTLEATYKTLTGGQGGFAAFAALLERHFPTGHPVDLADDNPFPLK